LLSNVETEQLNFFANRLMVLANENRAVVVQLEVNRIRQELFEDVSSQLFHDGDEWP